MSLTILSLDNLVTAELDSMRESLDIRIAELAIDLWCGNLDNSYPNFTMNIYQSHIQFEELRFLKI
jgi:hypothetical protein